MAINLRERLFSFDEYLSLERASDTKCEFVDGRIYAMAGGTPEHSGIASNIIAALVTTLRDTPCRVFGSDLKVRGATSAIGSYADVTVVCGDLEYHDADKDVVTNPIVLVEVLSPTTEDFDRGLKFLRYQTIPALRDYILIYQTEPCVVIHHRQSHNQWISTTYRGMEASVPVASLDCELALSDMYAKIVFPSS